MRVLWCADACASHCAAVRVDYLKPHWENCSLYTSAGEHAGGLMLKETKEKNVYMAFTLESSNQG